MAINLRYVSKELHSLLKARAATEQVTIESLCVNYLWMGLDQGGRNDRDIERIDVGRVHDADQRGAAGGSRKRATVPVLPKAKGKAEHIHPVQSVRDELVQGSGYLQASAHEGHQTFIAGDGHWCSDCSVAF